MNAVAIGTPGSRVSGEDVVVSYSRMKGVAIHATNR